MIKKLYRRLSEKGNLPLLGSFFAAAFFCLLLTRLFVKMDDGNFLGIVNAPDFTYAGWLTQRYNTLSGRTVGEFLLAFFLRRNIVFWKICNCLLIIYVMWFWCRLSEFGTGGFSLQRRKMFCCCGFFLVLISCLNPSVFWFAGSFTYLWPFAGLLITVAPLLFCLLGGRVKPVEAAFSFLFAPLACAQEQTAACCAALWIILLITLLCRKIRFNFLLLLPAAPICVCCYFLFTSPGARGRAAMEAAGFARYLTMSLPEKLGCGLSVFFANSFFLSNFLILLLVALLSAVLYLKTKKHLRLLIAVNAATAALCIGANYVLAAVKRALPHMIVRSAYIKGEFGADFYILFAGGCLLTAVVLTLLICLTVKSRSLGAGVALCLAAGFGSAMVMSFSPSIFQSGQRAYFVTEMFIVTACVILFSNAEKNKLTGFLYKAALFYAGASFAVDCFAFRLAELPVMG